MDRYPNIELVGDGEGNPYEAFKLTEPEAGEWIVKVKAIEIDPGESTEPFNLQVKVDTSLEMKMGNKSRYLVREPINFNLLLRRDGEALEGSTIKASIKGQSGSEDAKVEYIGRGIYTVSFLAKVIDGDYTISATAEGKDSTGGDFKREASASVYVARLSEAEPEELEAILIKEGKSLDRAYQGLKKVEEMLNKIKEKLN